MQRARTPWKRESKVGPWWPSQLRAVFPHLWDGLAVPHRLPHKGIVPFSGPSRLVPSSLPDTLH